MQNLNKFSRKELLKLLAIVILSDGCISNNGKSKCIQLETISYNRCQHELFDYLCRKIFKKAVKSHIFGNSNIITSRLYGKEFASQLLLLSSTFQTTPGPNLSKDKFLKSDQPSLKFLDKKDKKILKITMLRIWFDFDGSIVPSFKLKFKKDKKNGKIYPYYQIQFQCDVNISETNPNLIKDLINLCKELGLNPLLIKKDNWSGIEGVRMCELKSIRKFIEFGGPITNVKISAKSPRFLGITKSAVCRGIVNLLNKKIPLSYYFKNKEEALIKKEELNKLLINEIKKS
ncbi:hypothetical protein CL617_00245 [archaeon]|nr:hypothetical protein [archaeon]|tara:strand:+ start:8525 stop:9388 length:864 start_codon:yes stop_codon:yes gene_type:complete